MLTVCIRAPHSSARQWANGKIRFSGGYKSLLVHTLGLDSLEDLAIWLPRLIRHRGFIRFDIDMTMLRMDLRRVFTFLRRGKRRFNFPVDVEPKLHRKVFEYRVRQFHRIMPSLKRARVARGLSGYVDLTPDMVPVLGEVEYPKGFVIVAGFSGHGFALGPIIGRLMSELILDGKPSLSLDTFRPSRFVEGKVEMPTRLL